MAALKQKLTRLEELIGSLPASPCLSCHGFGHPKMFMRPLIGDETIKLRFGEAVLIPYDRLDADGCWVNCGARSVLAPTVELELPPMLRARHARVF